MRVRTPAERAPTRVSALLCFESLCVATILDEGALTVCRPLRKDAGAILSRARKQAVSCTKMSLTLAAPRADSLRFAARAHVPVSSLVAKGAHRIDAQCAARGQQRRQQCDRDHARRRNQQAERIVRPDSVKLRSDERVSIQVAGSPMTSPAHTVSATCPSNIRKTDGAIRAQRHAHAQLTSLVE